MKWQHCPSIGVVASIEWHSGTHTAGLRIGLYPIIKKALGADAQQQQQRDGGGGNGGQLGRKVAAGMLSGALAAGISNPTDLVKTQMQKGAGGGAGGAFGVMARVVRTEGVRGLWVGTTPSMVRGRASAGAGLCVCRHPLPRMERPPRRLFAVAVCCRCVVFAVPQSQSDLSALASACVCVPSADACGSADVGAVRDLRRAQKPVCAAAGLGGQPANALYRCEAEG